MRTIAVFAILALVAASVYAQIPEHRVTSLPNLAAPLVEMYSGYINLPGTQKYYHYVFVPSTGSPSTDPVAVWLNGGPGCSSLDGFFYEHGPYKFGEGLTNTTLVHNPYAWTRTASIIYLESPVGVGFTYSNSELDYFTDDTTTASDNLNFLLAFFKSAPKYAQLPFYVFGESYAGVYVPMLAKAILDSNNAGKNLKINLRGSGSGNPVTNTDTESTLASWVPFTYGHGIMSADVHQTIMNNCPNNPNGFTCVNAINQANNGYQNLNIYYVNGPCFLGNKKETENKSRGRRIHEAMFPKNDPINRAAFSPMAEVPCIDSKNAENYLNRAVATSALHVNQIKWTICSDTTSYTSSGRSMLPYYQALLAANMRVLVYSGDADSVVPWTGTSKWVRTEMGQSSPVDDWVPWYYNDGINGLQVGGYKTVYSTGLTYTTIRGSGHMIAQFTPARSYHMFRNWIRNNPL